MGYLLVPTPLDKPIRTMDADVTNTHNWFKEQIRRRNVNIVSDGLIDPDAADGILSNSTNQGFIKCSATPKGFFQGGNFAKSIAEQEFAVPSTDGTYYVYALAKETDTIVTYQEDEFTPDHTYRDYTLDLLFSTTEDSTLGVRLGKILVSGSGTSISIQDTNRDPASIDAANIGGSLDPQKVNMLSAFDPNFFALLPDSKLKLKIFDIKVKEAVWDSNSTIKFFTNFSDDEWTIDTAQLGSNISTKVAGRINPLRNDRWYQLFAGRTSDNNIEFFIAEHSHAESTTAVSGTTVTLTENIARIFQVGQKSRLVCDNAGTGLVWPSGNSDLATPTAIPSANQVTFDALPTNFTPNTATAYISQLKNFGPYKEADGSTDYTEWLPLRLVFRIDSSGNIEETFFGKNGLHVMKANSAENYNSGYDLDISAVTTEKLFDIINFIPIIAKDITFQFYQSHSSNSISSYSRGINETNKRFLCYTETGNHFNHAAEFSVYVDLSLQYLSLTAATSQANIFFRRFTI